MKKTAVPLKKKKTIRQWLNTLPVPFNHLAIEEYEKNPHKPLVAYEKVNNILDALWDGLKWSDTELGMEFWQGVYSEMCFLTTGKEVMSGLPSSAQTLYPRPARPKGRIVCHDEPELKSLPPIPDKYKIPNITARLYLVEEALSAQHKLNTEMKNFITWFKTQQQQSIISQPAVKTPVRITIADVFKSNLFAFGWFIKKENATHPTEILARRTNLFILLTNICVYFNKGWKPNPKDPAWTLFPENGYLTVCAVHPPITSPFIFQTSEAAKTAKDNFSELFKEFYSIH